MWCSSCQQDVPALGRAGSTKLACSRCFTTLKPPHATGISESGIELDDQPALELVDARPSLLVDDWQLRQRTRELGRKLRVDAPEKQYRLDPPHGAFAELAAQTATPIVEPGNYSRPTPTASAPRPESSQIVAWLVTLVGFVALATGLGMIGWTMANNGSAYWDRALALTLAGQGILIFGLVLVVARLWRASRHAAGKLQEVHLEIGQLQRTAEALTATRNGGAPAFYAELVRGASPQMLLSNLRGQLEQLATRLEGRG